MPEKSTIARPFIRLTMLLAQALASELAE